MNYNEILKKIMKEEHIGLEQASIKLIKIIDEKINSELESLKNVLSDEDVEKIKLLLITLKGSADNEVLDRYYAKTPSIKTKKGQSMLANGKVIDEYEITSMIKPICENIVKYRTVNDELKGSLENAKKYDELYLEKSEYWKNLNKQKSNIEQQH